MPYNSKFKPSDMSAADLLKYMKKGSSVISESWPESPWRRNYLIFRCDIGREYLEIKESLINELLSAKKIRKVSAPRWLNDQFDTYHLMIVQNATELLEFLKQDAILISRWVYGRRINNLKLSTGENLTVQYSNIQSLLKHGKIRSVLLSGDNYDYYLVKPQCPTI